MDLKTAAVGASDVIVNVVCFSFFMMCVYRRGYLKFYCKNNVCFFFEPQFNDIVVLYLLK